MEQGVQCEQSSLSLDGLKIGIYFSNVLKWTALLVADDAFDSNCKQGSCCPFPVQPFKFSRGLSLVGMSRQNAELAVCS